MRATPGGCHKFEFDDNLLKYSVTLWEMHYPKKVNNFFEFIEFVLGIIRVDIVHFTGQ